MTKHKIFVYGSLMRGFGNHSWLGDSKFLGYDCIDGYSLYSLGSFPAIVKGEGTVYGEVYEVGETTLTSLDYLEGHPDFYARKDVFLHDIEGPAQAYVLPRESLSVLNIRIPDGDWRNYKCL